MIKSCRDVKTLDDFYEFCHLYRVLDKIGLEETSRIIRWNEYYTVSPEILPLLRWV